MRNKARNGTRDALSEISSRLLVSMVLEIIKISETGLQGRFKRIPCPIHGGEKNNFSVSADDRRWTCWSHGCGDGHPRDAINLYCWIRYGSPFTGLSNKKQVVNELLAIVGLSENDVSYKKTTIWDRMAEHEKQMIGKIFRNTDRLDVADLGDQWFYGTKIAKRVILYLHICNSSEKLPKKITRKWCGLKDLEAFCRGLI